MSTFPGNNEHMPGAYRMERRFTGVNHAAMTEVDFRNANWFGGADLLTADERTAAQARGELKQVNIIVTSGDISAGDIEAPANGQTYFADAATSIVGITMNYSNRMGRSSIWIQTPSGAADFAIEVFIDIPPA